MASIVDAQQVGYHYADGRQGLAPVSLRVQAGECVGVRGPSGCGKSTLARCLSGLIPHLYRGTLQGRVELDGLCTADAPLWRLAEVAGLVFQNPAAQMLALTVEEEIIFGLENLGLPAPLIAERLAETLSTFGLGALRGRSPQTLSGGEQQKLALAAVMARRPPLLVLDEPLSMLDTSAAFELVGHLTRLLRADVAVVICEHRSEYLRAIDGLRTLELDGQVPAHPVAPGVPAPFARAGAAPLRVEGLSVALDGRPILRDLHLDLAGGQVAAIVGRNGVGKTTLLRALCGLQPHAGTVTVDGAAPDLGMVFQEADAQLFNATVREEILYRVPDADPARYRWLLAALGLERYEDTPPLLLSEGEKKRVALATVLMRGPRHGVLLDEPALGQDATHKAMLAHVARALAACGQVVVITTHDLALAAQADRLLLLGAEGWVADGPPAAVLPDATAWAALGLRVPAWVHADERWS